MASKSPHNNELEAHFEARKNALASVRSQVESIMDEITELVCPHRPYMNSIQSYTVLPNQDIYDQTGAQALKFLVSLVDSGTANPGMRWFSLKPKAFLGAAPSIITDYLYYVTSSILSVFDDPEAGFYSSNPVIISDLAAYGTSCMSISYEPGEGFKFSPIHISEIYIAEGSGGKINTVLRKLAVTAIQCVERFGLDNVTEEIKKAAQTDPDKNFNVWHYAAPNIDYITLKPAVYKNKPFKSCYLIESSDKNRKYKLVEESYLSNFPYNVPRWFKRPGIPWGFGPVGIGLPNLRSIQNMEMDFQAAVQFVARPILLASDDGVLLPNVLEPGSVIPGGKDSLTNNSRLEPLPMTAIPQYMGDYLKEKKEDIKTLLYSTGSIALATKQMTREEVLVRKEEQMLSIGPDLKLYMDEHLIPSINKVYSLLLENKLIQPPPDEIKEILAQGLKIEFNSPMLRYQRVSEVQTAQQILAMAVQIGQFDSSVMNVINARGLLNLVRDVMQAPSNIFNTEEQQRAMEQLAQSQHQQELQIKLADMADKNRYMLQQSGGDPNSSAVAALTQMNGGSQGGFNGFES